MLNQTQTTPATGTARATSGVSKLAMMQVTLYIGDIGYCDYRPVTKMAYCDYFANPKLIFLA